MGSIKYKDKLKKRLLQNFSEVDNVIYKENRDSLNSIINKCKHDYYNIEIEKTRTT